MTLKINHLNVLISYYSWMNDTQAISCLTKIYENSNQPGSFLIYLPVAEIVAEISTERLYKLSAHGSPDIGAVYYWQYLKNNSSQLLILLKSHAYKTQG